MGVKQVLEDDLTGAQLPEGTKPQSVTFEGKKYEVYLSADSSQRFVEFLSGNAPLSRSSSVTTTVTRRGLSSSRSSSDKERNKAVRAWAQSTGFKYKNAEGDEVALGDRGRIPSEVFDAYDKAN